jgi:hypothetical protein
MNIFGKKDNDAVRVPEIEVRDGEVEVGDNEQEADQNPQPRRSYKLPKTKWF